MENKQQGWSERFDILVIHHLDPTMPLGSRIEEIKSFIKSILVEKAEKVRWMHCSEFETKGDLKEAILKIIEE